MLLIKIVWKTTPSITLQSKKSSFEHFIEGQCFLNVYEVNKSQQWI